MRPCNTYKRRFRRRPLVRNKELQKFGDLADEAATELRWPSLSTEKRSVDNNVCQRHSSANAWVLMKYLDRPGDKCRTCGPQAAGAFPNKITHRCSGQTGSGVTKCSALSAAQRDPCGLQMQQVLLPFRQKRGTSRSPSRSSGSNVRERQCL